MSLDNELKALADYRFEQSLECLKSAKVLAECGDYRGAANRSYYFSDMIKSAFYVRNNSDYDDFYVISKADVEEQIENAEKFCKAVGEYLQAQGIVLTVSKDSNK